MGRRGFFGKVMAALAALGPGAAAPESRRYARLFTLPAGHGLWHREEAVRRMTAGVELTLRNLLASMPPGKALEVVGEISIGAATVKGE